MVYGDVISGTEWLPLKIREGISYKKRLDSFKKEIIEFEMNVLISEIRLELLNYEILEFYEHYVYVNNNIWDRFYEKFRYYIVENKLKYDNLINLLIMVKNAGDDFRNVLIENLPYVDRWTFLDTGSTDNTVEIIKEVMKDKRGTLYQEPFINFRDSRNRLLELAGTDCVFNIMLDDTYILKGRVREFLEFVRGDDVADSYSLIIDGTDTLYSSNRITKSEKKLRYENLVHEIIENNLNIEIPLEYGYIYDKPSQYMQERTKERKQQDIDILLQMNKDDPTNPRTYYYIADSYIGTKEWDKALYWFKKRVEIGDGFSSEVQDSLYYIAAISENFLNVPWEICHQLYLDCYNYDLTRGDSLYLIGSHYYKNNNNQIAYMYMKTAFELGLPKISMSVRKHIYNYYLPKDLMELCYKLEDYQLAEKCCNRLIKENYKPEEKDKFQQLLNIFLLFNNTLKYDGQKTECPGKKTICFISPGGWDKWDGETLYKKGLGGSETFTVKYTEKLVEFGYNVIVFCNCENDKIVNNVCYLPLQKIVTNLPTLSIDYCIINRYPEYIPYISKFVDNVYCVFHDLFGNLLLLDTPQLKKIFLISDWHKQVFLEKYPEFINKTDVVSYGIDLNSFENYQKENMSFIFPSFPNRGLLPLLQMFPKIKEKYPNATLNIFCNLKHKWVQEHHKHTIDEIEKIIEQPGVINHGWIDYITLRNYWTKSQYWFYPCTFEETCCLTAYEAAASKTVIISNNKAALKESIGDRGIILDGNPYDSEWQNQILNKLFNIIELNQQEYFINKNYDWIKNKSFNIVVTDFINKIK
jgi:hypothetical protein